MPRRIRLEPHMAHDELYDHYRRAVDPVEHSHWHFLWLLGSGMTAAAAAAVTDYSAYWIGQIAHRYDAEGRDGVRDRRHTALRTKCSDMLDTHLMALGVAFAGLHPQGNR